MIDFNLIWRTNFHAFSFGALKCVLLRAVIVPANRCELFWGLGFFDFKPAIWSTTMTSQSSGSISNSLLLDLESMKLIVMREGLLDKTGHDLNIVLIWKFRLLGHNLIMFWEHNTSVKRLKFFTLLEGL